MSAPAPPSLQARGGRDAGFWKREVAYFIDVLLLGALLNLVLFALLAASGGGDSHALPALLQEASAAAATGAPDVLLAQLLPLLQWLGRALLASMALYAVLGWGYFAGMESSAHQATLGKQALGLRVTDLHGRRLSLAQATARFFAAALSWLTLNLGHALAAWSPERRALHDYVAGTRVENRDWETRGAAAARLPGWALALVWLQGIAAVLMLLAPLLLAGALLAGGL